MCGSMPDINDILRLIDREIWLVSAEHEDRRGGLIATFVSQASIVPELPRMLVGIAKQHHTCGLIEASRAFTLHLLDESHLDWVWRFGLQSGHAVEKFTGLPELDAVAWLACRVETSLDTGDRTLYLAGSAGRPAPEDNAAADDAPPLATGAAGAVERIARGPGARCGSGCRGDSGLASAALSYFRKVQC